MQLSSKVTADFKNVPLIDYLATRFKYLSRDEWLVRIENGRISHNDQLCQAETLVTQGDIVTYTMPDDAEPRQDYTVLYEDDWMMAVDKAPDLLVHAVGPFIRENLIYQLRTWHTPPLPDIHLVNRLDRDTSGVILLAKSKDILRQMSALFAETAVQKTYLAIVHGQPAQPSGTIDHPIIKLPKDDGPPRFAPSDDPKAKTAVTHYETVEPLGNKHTLLRLFPKTGRTHQLRVHLLAIGCPIVGDKVYGRSDTAQRQYLHCHSNTFIHPHTQTQTTITAPLPADMQTFINEAKNVS